MKFYSRKAPKKKAYTLIEKISAGKCDDMVIGELKVAMAEETTPEDAVQIADLLLDIVLRSSNYTATSYAIKALMSLLPLDPGTEEALEGRVLELARDRSASGDKQLMEAIASFLYWRVSERVERAQPFVPALIALLDECSSVTCQAPYNTLMIVAANMPEYFEPHTGMLVRMLGSIKKATRVQSAKIIAVLASCHPEYVVSAEKTLLHLSTFYPDAEVKSAAAEAYQILSRRLRPENRAGHEERLKRPEPEATGGLAEIMRRKESAKDTTSSAESRIDSRLLSMATNFARKSGRNHRESARAAPAPEAGDPDHEAFSKIIDDFSEIAQSIKTGTAPAETAAAAPPEAAPVQATPGPESSQEAELRDMMEQVRDDFSITASSILDAIGMGHLARKPLDGRPVSEPAQPVSGMTEPGPAEIAQAPIVVEAQSEEPESSDADGKVSSREFIASIEKMLNKHESAPKAEARHLVTAAAAAQGPNEPETPGPMAEAKDSSSLERVEEPKENATTKPLEEAVLTKPDSIVAENAPKDKAPAIDSRRYAKSPIIPAGVRMSAMKFKTVDRTKKPPPAKISIRPYIRPLSRTPLDAIKSTPSKLHDPATAKNDGAINAVTCPSCKAKMPEDMPRCPGCGADVKSPKVRCRSCGEINLLQSNSCSRCGSNINNE